MHILHFILGGSGLPIPAIYGGAVQQTIEELSSEFVKKGHKVTVIAVVQDKYSNEIKKTDKKGVNYIYVYYRKSSRNEWLNKLKKSIYKVLENGPYDIVNLHVPHWSLLFKIISRKIGNPKIFWHVHNRSKYAFISKLSNINIVGISESVLLGNKIDTLKESVSIIPNLCRMNFFPLATTETKLGSREEFNIDANQFLVGFAGRIAPEKGLHVVLEALNRLSRVERDNITLLIAGSSWFKNAEKTEYEMKVHEQSKNYNIKWLGYVDNWNLYKVYHACDLFIVPSVWEEPAGQVVLEAQSCGTHVIASKIGGIPEYLSPYETMINAGDSQDLSKNISYFMNDKLKRTKAISKMRSEWVDDKFNKNKLVNMWLDLYSKNHN